MWYALFMRVTQIRKKLADIIEHADAGISVAQILKKHKELDKVTVYRALKVFEKNNLIRRIETRTRHAVYEWVGKGHHHHAICTSCGHMEHVHDAHVERVLQKKNVKGFKIITDHSCEWYGVCTSCA